MVLFSLTLILLVAVSNIQSKSFVVNNLENNNIRVKRADNELVASTNAEFENFTVVCNVVYRYAITTISHKHINPEATAKSLSFTVNLPEGAFISKFLMVFRGTVYEAKVAKKEEAKALYDDAKAKGKTAGHVELSVQDSNLFTVSVNVEAYEKVKFELTYEQLLVRTQGVYNLVIPVSPGKVTKDFHVNVVINDGATIVRLKVQDLKIDATNSKQINAHTEFSSEQKTAKIFWNPNIQEQQQISQNGVTGQFIVSYEIDRADSNQFMTEQNYFAVFFASNTMKILNKHIIFVLDMSNSMHGVKIQKLGESLHSILNDLRDGDYFSIVLFSEKVELWTLNGLVDQKSSIQETIIPASRDNVEKARAYAKNIKEEYANTNIIAGLRSSLEIANYNQGKRMEEKPCIVFLSDGLPNVEMTNTDDIIKEVSSLNINKFPIFCLAYGDDADLIFLRKLSLTYPGFAKKITISEDTSLQLKNFYNDISAPQAYNVSFNFMPGEVDESSVSKPIFNTLYNGSELVLAGKMSGNGVSALMVTSADKSWFGIIAGNGSPHSATKNTKKYLERLWSYLRIKELLDKYLVSDNTDIRDEALNLALKYSFVTPLTSLYIVGPDKSSTVQEENTSPESPAGTPQDPSVQQTPQDPSGQTPPPPPPPPTVVTQPPSMICRGSLQPLAKFPWLKCKDQLKLPPSNTTYSIFLGKAEPDEEYAMCVVPNGEDDVSRCRHLVFCDIPEIKKSLKDFQPYAKNCVINNKYIGVCCPP